MDILKLPYIRTILFVILATVTANSLCFGYELVDDEQQKISFPEPFSRIISLYPAHTENLADLGCTEKIIGIGRSDNFPQSIQDIPRYSYHDNTEKFLAGRPDLILIRPMISRSKPELIKKLRSSGIKIVSLQPTSVNEMYSYWQKLGSLCGATERSSEIVSEFKEHITFMHNRLPEIEKRPRVYFESIHTKMKTFAPDGIASFVLQSAGGVNVAEDAIGRNKSNIAPYGKERILSKAQEIDIFLSQNGRMNRVEVDDIYTEPGFSLIKAIQNKAVFLVDEEIVSRPTRRLLAGMRTIHSFLYPGDQGNKPNLTNQYLSQQSQPTN